MHLLETILKYKLKMKFLVSLGLKTGTGTTRTFGKESSRPGCS